MINYYKVIGVDQNKSTGEINKHCKELLQNINKSKITLVEKEKLTKQVVKAYKFLNDYHNRKSLDEYLNNKNQQIIRSDENKSLINPFLFKSFEDLIDKSFIKNIKNSKNSKSYFYSSSQVSKTEPDKDGNMVTKTSVITNNNGKKNKNTYTRINKRHSIK